MAAIRLGPGAARQPEVTPGGIAAAFPVTGWYVVTGKSHHMTFLITLSTFAAWLAGAYIAGALSVGYFISKRTPSRQTKG